MSGKDFRLHNGVKGAALGIRVIPRARRDEIVEVLHDGTVKVRLSDSGGGLNESLKSLLAGVLGISVDKIDIVAGKSKRDKLVSILDMAPASVNKKIISNLT